MKNTIYKYFSHEFMRYFSIVLFALVAIIWAIQAVNFLDLVTEDGHAFRVYLFYSTLTIPKIFTKLIPFSFLIASIITIMKFEKDNELIILWTSGLNKIRVVNHIFRLSIFVILLQLIMSIIITPETLKISRSLLKNSELQFVSSMLKEKQFNDKVKGLTIFVDKKNKNGIYDNIFIKDDGKILTEISDGASTIFAKSGYVTSDEKNLVLLNGNIQKTNEVGDVTIVKFEKTFLNLSGISTKSISETKIQETSTINIFRCMQTDDLQIRNCSRGRGENKDLKIEINKRFGMPMFIPLVALISCFLLSSRRDRKTYTWNKYISFVIGFAILISSEILVRYSGASLNYAIIYYFIPLGLFPMVYLYLIRVFKYENLN